MGYLRSVDESHIHFLRYFLWHDDILAMGIYQRITVDFLLPIVVGTTEFLIIIIGVFLHIPTAANHGIHDHRNTSLGTSLIYISAEIVGKGSLCISMTLWVWLLIIMSELNDNIIARLDFVMHLLPSALIDKTLRTSAIHSMVINENLVIETTLEYHTPTSLRTTLESRFLCSSGISDNKNSRQLTAGSHQQRQDQAGDISQYLLRSQHHFF